MKLIADGKAPKIIQPKEGATYEGIQKKENAKVEYKDMQEDHFPLPDCIVQFVYTKAS